MNNTNVRQDYFNNCNIAIKGIKKSHHGNWTCLVYGEYTGTYGDTIDIYVNNMDESLPLEILGIFPVILGYISVICHSIYKCCRAYLVRCCCCIPKVRKSSEVDSEEMREVDSEEMREVDSEEDTISTHTVDTIL